MADEINAGTTASSKDDTVVSTETKELYEAFQADVARAHEGESDDKANQADADEDEDGKADEDLESEVDDADDQENEGDASDDDAGEFDFATDTKLAKLLSDVPEKTRNAIEKRLREMGKGAAKAIDENRGYKEAQKGWDAVQAALENPSTAPRAMAKITELASQWSGLPIEKLLPAAKAATPDHLDVKNLERWDELGYGSKKEMELEIKHAELEQRFESLAAGQKESQENARREAQKREASLKFDAWAEANYDRVQRFLRQREDGWSIGKDQIIKALGGKIPRDIASAAQIVKERNVDALAAHLRKVNSGQTDKTSGSKPSGRGGSDTSQFPKNPVDWKSEDFFRLQNTG